MRPAVFCEGWDGPGAVFRTCFLVEFSSAFFDAADGFAPDITALASNSGGCDELITLRSDGLDFPLVCEDVADGREGVFSVETFRR